MFSDYKNGRKNQWRRTMWNQIADRVPRSERRDALILYLPGPCLLDEPLAVARGFQAKNMIAVERDPRVRDALRRAGRLVDYGTIEDVVSMWPRDRRVGVVFADLTCGFEIDPLQKLSVGLMSRAFDGAVVAINLLRGRDPASRGFRDAYVEALTAMGVPNKGVAHRGEMFPVLCSLAAARLVVAAYLSPAQIDADPGAVMKLTETLMRVFDLPDVATLTYRSVPANQTFDSAVFKNDLPKRMADWRVEHRIEWGKLPASLDGFVDLSQRRRTAAILAHHARR